MNLSQDRSQLLFRELCVLLGTCGVAFGFSNCSVKIVWDEADAFLDLSYQRFFACEVAVSCVFQDFRSNCVGVSTTAVQCYLCRANRVFGDWADLTVSMARFDDNASCNSMTYSDGKGLRNHRHGSNYPGTIRLFE